MPAQPADREGTPGRRGTAVIRPKRRGRATVLLRRGGDSVFDVRLRMFTPRCNPVFSSVVGEKGTGSLVKNTVTSSTAGGALRVAKSVALLRLVLQDPPASSVQLCATTSLKYSYEFPRRHTSWCTRGHSRLTLGPGVSEATDKGRR